MVRFAQDVSHEKHTCTPGEQIWVVVKIMVLFGVRIIIRPLIFRVPKKDHNFDNHPYGFLAARW